MLKNLFILLFSFNLIADPIEEILCKDSGNSIEVSYGAGDELILLFEDSKLITRVKHVKESILDLSGDDKLIDIKILKNSILFLYDKDKLLCKRIME